MNALKTFAATTSFAAASLISVPASAVIVAGVDFGVVGASFHIETGTIATSFVTGAGQATTSYGLITSVNGDTTYCADGSNNCALYFRTDAVSTSFGSADVYFGGTKALIFYSAAAPINLLSQSSAANLAFLGTLTPWATFTGENGVDPTAAGLVSDTRSTLMLTGATISASSSSLWSVSTADGLGNAAAEAFLNSNAIPTFVGSFADVAVTASGNNFVLNPFDVANLSADSCRTGSPETGDWCIQGSTDIRGLTVPPPPVPEPASSALFALGLALLGFARRASKS